ncbi:MAG: hypothetical protein WA231_09875 [Methylocella sp.]
MTIHAKGPPPGRGGGPLELSFPGGNDFEPNSPIQATAQAISRDQRTGRRRQRLVENLHRLGPAPLGHFIREIEEATGADVTARLERYAALPADFIKANGGDRFAPSLWAIEGGRR